MEGDRLILICGEDDFAVTQSAKSRIDALVPEGERDFGLDVIDGDVANADAALAVVNECYNSLKTDAFFGASSKVTWLRNASFFVSRSGASAEDSSDAPGSGGGLSPVAKLTELIKQGVAEGHVFVVSCFKINRASSLFKTFKSMGTVEDFGGAKKPWEQAQAAESFARTWMKRLGLELETEARRLFLQRVGSDSRMIASELEKLALYVHPATTATAADVERLTSVGREAEAWGLLDAFDARDVRRVLAELEPFAGDKGAPIMFSAMLDTHLRELIAVRWALDRRWIVNGRWATNLPPEEQSALACSPVNPDTTNAWKLGKLMRNAGNYSMVELRMARFSLNQFRARLVSLSVDGLLLLQTTLVKIVTRPRR